MKTKLIFGGILLFFFLIFGLFLKPALALDIPLTIANREAVAKTAEPITSGVPFAEGVVTAITQVRLLQNNVEIPAQFKILARWPDNSIRWLLVDFQTDIPASGARPSSSRQGPPRPQSPGSRSTTSLPL